MAVGRKNGTCNTTLKSVTEDGIAVLSARTVVLIEPDPQWRKQLAELIGSHGAVVLEAQDGIEGQEMIQIHDADLVVMGIMLPKLDGWQLFANLRTRLKMSELPVVFVTELFEEEQIEFLNRGEGSKARIVSKQSGLNDIESALLAVA